MARHICVSLRAPMLEIYCQPPNRPAWYHSSRSIDMKISRRSLSSYGLGKSVSCRNYSWVLRFTYAKGLQQKTIPKRPSVTTYKRHFCQSPKTKQNPNRYVPMRLFKQQIEIHLNDVFGDTQKLWSIHSMCSLSRDWMAFPRPRRNPTIKVGVSCETTLRRVLLSPSTLCRSDGLCPQQICLVV